MRFSPRNLYYLRISASTVLPLYLYLDEQHLEWMSERVLQHVLSDLRPLIPNKLIAEADAYLGLGGPANAKRGTVDVHRGDTYQFGYFLRNTDPHAVLIKTRTFTARPKVPKQLQPANKEREQNPPEDETQMSNKRKRTVTSKKRKIAIKPPAPRKRTNKAKGKQKARNEDSESDARENVDEEAEEHEDETTASSYPALPAPRRSTRKRTVIAGIYNEEDEEENGDYMDFREIDGDRDTPTAVSATIGTSTMAKDPQSNDEDSMQLDDTNVVAEPAVKTEDAEPMLKVTASSVPDSSELITIDDEPPATPGVLEGPSDSLLVEEEDEEKPKPIMSLKYRGFSIHGRCLCVIVEPYPPLRQQRTMSLAPTGLTGPRAPSIAPADFLPSGGAGQRARTPLFLPEPDWDREKSVTPAPVQQHIRPPVPLFDEEPAEAQDEEPDGGMMAFSQILQSVGGYTMGAVEDDDEIDGAVFLGDADEARGL